MLRPNPFSRSFSSSHLGSSKKLGNPQKVLGVLITKFQQHATCSVCLQLSISLWSFLLMEVVLQGKISPITTSLAEKNDLDGTHFRAEKQQVESSLNSSSVDFFLLVFLSTASLPLWLQACVCPHGKPCRKTCIWVKQF